MVWIRILFLLGNLSLFFWQGPTAWVDSWWGFPPVFFLFLCFASGLLGWGIFWERRFGGKGAAVFLYSSVTAIAFSMALGHLGLIGDRGRPLFVAFLVLGNLLALISQTEGFLLGLSGIWLNAIFVFIFLLRFFSGYLPQAHGDPLLYHLMAPRLWNLQGIVRLNHDLPVPLLASTWEYFYLWPQVLFTKTQATIQQLVMAQIFSQWIHLLWGLFGSILVLRELLTKRLDPKNNFSYALLFMALLFVPSMQWTGALAKNDCGVAFWCLGALLYFWKEHWASWLFAGVLTGLAVSGKINAILFVIPIGVVTCLRFGVSSYKAGTIRQLTSWSPFLLLSSLGLLGAVIGATPVYLRNWLETRNPFYTMFAHIFPSAWISQSWADHFSTHQPSEHSGLAEILIYRIDQLAHEGPGFWLWLSLPILFFQKHARAWIKENWDLFALFFVSLFVCIFAVEKNAEVRYLGAALWLGSILGVWFVLVALEKHRKTLFAVQFVLLGVLLATSHLPTHFLWKFLKTPVGEKFVLQHSAGDAKAWLRQNAGRRLVVISGDNETYYLSTIRSTVLTERPDIDAATYGKADLKEFLRGLCQTSGAGLLLDARDNAALKGRFPNPAWDQAVLFQGAGARVYDLVKLQSLILQTDAGCGHT